MYKLDEMVGTQIKDTAIFGRKDARGKIFPGQSFSIFLVQFLFVGIVGGLIIKLLTPRSGGNPDYH